MDRSQKPNRRIRLTRSCLYLRRPIALQFSTAVLLSVLASAGTLPPNAAKFVCGPTNGPFSTLSPATRYTESAAGFDLVDSPSVEDRTCTSDKPFFFSIPVPEGSYRVTVALGGPTSSVTTVRAEGRRLMLEKIPTEPNGALTRSFDVNVRYPEISGDRARLVKLKPREQGILDWDHKLTLEFNGDHPSVRSIAIQPIQEPTIYLAGDSTVVDQYYEPWSAWGQLLPRFFLPGVVVANHAESGETTKAFIAEHRLEKIMSLIKPGDYLFIQFAHNDMKPGAVPLDQYKQLLADYIAQTRARGATPVLVTSMNRRTFDASGHITNSFGPYPEAMREIARDDHVNLIDLNTMSKTLFEALGPEESKKAFMHYPANAYPNQTEAINDDTHFNSYGAYELARCIVRGIREANLPLAKFLDPTIPTFDPSHPDPVGTFSLPPTPILLKMNVMKVGQTGL